LRRSRRADDYVTEPFQVKEIGARLRVLRRRAGVTVNPGGASPAEQTTLVLDSHGGPLVLDVNAGVVRRGADEVHLTLTEFRLLCELASPAVYGKPAPARSLPRCSSVPKRRPFRQPSAPVNENPLRRSQLRRQGWRPSPAGRRLFLPRQ
jgi:hypothetical protein